MNLTKVSERRTVRFNVTDGPFVDRMVQAFDGPPGRQRVQTVAVEVTLAFVDGEWVITSTMLLVDTDVGTFPVTALLDGDDPEVAHVVGLAHAEALEDA